MKRTLKKAMSILLAFTLLFGSLASGLSDVNWLGFVVNAKAEDSIASGTCGENLTWTLDESTGTLTISGTGKMYIWSNSSNAPWFSNRLNIKNVTIGNGVTSISDYAFAGCSSLTSITIPDSVTSIGDYAFYICTSLTSVTIGNSVTSIGSYAFGNCSSLTSVIIPDSVTRIGGRAFDYCTSLTSVTIGNSVTSIGDGAFNYCKSLTSVTIGNSVTSIGYNAFNWCDSLTDVYYIGTEEEWNAITIDYGSDSLLNAFFHFIDDPDEPTTKPSTDKPVEIPTTTKPIVTEPSTTKPVEVPSTTKPVEAPTTTKPIVTEPSTTKPVEIPTTTKPIVTESSTTKPVVTEPTTNKPTTKPVETTKPTAAPTTKPSPGFIFTILEPSVSVIKYGETLILHTNLTSISANEKIEWSVDGEGVTIVPSEDGKTCAVTSTSTGDVTVTAKYTDSNGIEHVSEQEIKSNASFWQKIVSFFKNLFGINRIIEQRIKF